ncbi:uncharacterized protein LOC110744509 [Prunus avium]|uniref:Uncharacterized protein LOC110744509 n=1 Tax=Prunus avium TaxID=42229 RepID=A0A6P5R5D4_PRUAV|nr:uncharacterized protein LOC110744509 [Prunus avium]
MRNNGFDVLVDEVSSFCDKHHIDVPNMDEAFVLSGRSRRNAPIKTNRHHYRVDLFIYVIDEQLTKLDDRFNEVNTELLICLACLSPNDSFVAFDKQKLLRLAQFYPQDFSDGDLLALEDQLELYIHYVRSSSNFSELQRIGGLAKTMVETRMHRAFNYVYLLITLALVLLVATASAKMVIDNKVKESKLKDASASKASASASMDNAFASKKAEKESFLKHFFKKEVDPESNDQDVDSELEDQAFMESLFQEEVES